jgi:hypothetical protein
MSIPLDRLYHFIDQTAREIYGDGVLIYRFWPHGSKNIDDLNLLCACTWAERICSPAVWCNDQEPLDHDYYRTQQRTILNKWQHLLQSLNVSLLSTNLNYNSTNVFRKNLLLHSEKRSGNVGKYIADDKLIPVYYWSHALLAQDWFRYAEHEKFKKNINKRFLIYNRAWGGTREYRLRFSDLLIENKLANQCLTFCNPIEHGRHYQDHAFTNSVWRPVNVLENYFLPSTADSSYSADFNAEDYESTEIEVVLETLFDDDRLHLTEKSLRPIACRQPFILAATHGSLRYLRDYGFETFDSIWDETYDTIEDPYHRMQAIIKLMREITTWSDAQRRVNAQRMAQIVDHNHKHFFSKCFSNLVTNELRTNMTRAFDQMKVNLGADQLVGSIQNLLKFAQVQDFLNSNHDPAFPTKQQYEKVLEFIQQYPKTIADSNKI